MKKFIGRIILVIAAAFAVLAGVAVAASAIVERAKDDCIVGEQVDGYLGYVDRSKASPELVREVRAINQQRKAYYAQIAERNGVTVEVTAKLAGEKLVNQAPSGECVRDSTGRWKRK